MAQPSVRRLAAWRPLRRTLATRRSTAAISVPGAVTSGRGRSPAGLPIRAAFAALRPRRVQPFKAVPRSGDGRRPEASRGRGYEPRPQAPQPPPPSFASHENALGVGRMCRNIVQRQINVKYAFSNCCRAARRALPFQHEKGTAIHASAQRKRSRTRELATNRRCRALRRLQTPSEGRACGEIIRAIEKT